MIGGGVAGGMSAATRLRRLLEGARITVFERSGYVSFANCGLTYYAGGVIADRDELLPQTPESLAARFRLDARVHHEVLSIDRAAKTVGVRGGSTGAETTVPYDALVLSPGAEPVLPSIPGIERALSLRDVEDADTMVEALRAAESAGRTTAAVIGGGFIRLELAENLVERGLDVAVIEATEQVMAPLDPEMAGPVQWHELPESLASCAVLVDVRTPWVRPPLTSALLPDCPCCPLRGSSAAGCSGRGAWV